MCSQVGIFCSLQEKHPEDKGRAQIPQLVKSFQSQCIQKIKDKKEQFGPEELEAGEKK